MFWCVWRVAYNIHSFSGCFIYLLDKFQLCQNCFTVWNFLMCLEGDAHWLHPKNGVSDCIHSYFASLTIYQTNLPFQIFCTDNYILANLQDVNWHQKLGVAWQHSSSLNDLTICYTNFSFLKSLAPPNNFWNIYAGVLTGCIQKVRWLIASLCFLEALTTHKFQLSPKRLYQIFFFSGIFAELTEHVPKVRWPTTSIHFL